MNLNDIEERLLRLDEDADLTFDEDIEFECYIVGGGALMIMGYITRATHDIDILHTVPNTLQKLFAEYDMNCHVKAYMTNFPNGYEERAKKINLDTKRITFYTLSLEDLVISKLCSDGRDKDFVDIQSEKVVKDIDWDVLEELANNVRNNLFSSFALENFNGNYSDYVRRYKNEEVDI